MTGLKVLLKLFSEKKIRQAKSRARKVSPHNEEAHDIRG